MKQLIKYDSRKKNYSTSSRPGTERIGKSKGRHVRAGKEGAAMVNIEIRTGGESEKIRIETVRKNGVTLLQIRKLHLLGSEWRETGEVITMTPGEARAIGKDLIDCGIAELRKAPKPSWE